MYFTLKDTESGKPSWWLFGGNHQMVAWAGESFASSANAKRAAEAFKAGAADATYDVYEDKGGHWRWRAVRGNNTVATPGEAFSSQASAQRAADNVRDNAGEATL